MVSGGNRPYLVQYELGAWNIKGEFGDPIPGIGGTYGTFYDPEVRADGTVGFMNANAREFWAVHDGAVYAKSGDPIVAGDARTWTFTPGGSFEFASSNGADTYLAGRTTINGNSQSPVLVYNNAQVLLEPGDPIDVDGDGDFDENVTFFDFDPQGAGVDSLGRLVTAVLLRQQGSFTNYTSIIRLSPPNAPILSLSNVVAGQTADVQISNAPVGDLALTAFSLVGVGPTELSTPYGDILISLSLPWVETSTLTVDAQGEANWSQGVPANLAGAQVWAQGAAFGPSGIRATNPIATTIQ